jgi:hypothetical protein
MRVPRFLRQADLAELGISASVQTTRHLQKHEGFPLGRLLGPSTRVWTEDEINDWLASRPIEPSRQTKERVAKSINARKTACQTLDEDAA